MACKDCLGKHWGTPLRLYEDERVEEFNRVGSNKGNSGIQEGN